MGEKRPSADVDEGSKPRRRRSLPVRIVRTLAYVVLGIVALVALVLVAARLYVSDARLTEMVPSLLNETFVGEFSVSAIHWNFPFGATIEGVEIRDPDKKPVIAARRVHASIDVLPLLHQTIDLAVVEADGIDVKLFPPPPGSRAHGAFTLIDAFAPRKPSEEEPSSGPSWGFAIDEITIASASVALDRPDLGLRAGGIDIKEGGFEVSGGNIGGKGDLRVGALRLRQKAQGDDWKDLGPILVALDGAAYDHDLEAGLAKAKVESALVEAFHSSVHVVADLEDLGAASGPSGKAKGSIELALDDPGLAAVLPPALLEQLTPRGRALITFDASGSLEGGSGRLDLAGDGLELAGAAIARLELAAKSRDGVVTIDDLALIFPDGQVGARGWMNVEKPPLRHHLDVSLSDLPVRALASRFVDPKVLPERVRGRATFDGASLLDLETNAKIELAVAGIPASLTRGVVEALEIEATAVLSRSRVKLEPLLVTGGGTRLDARGVLPLAKDGAIELALRVENDSPSRAFARLGVPLRAERVRLDASLGGTMRDPRADGRLTVARLEAERIGAADAELPLHLEGGLFEVRQGQLSLLDGKARVDAQARLLERGEPVAEPSVAVQLALTDLSVDGPSGGQVSGRVSGHARFEGTAKSYAVRADLDPTALSVRDSTISVSRIEVAGTDREISLASVRIVPSEGGRLIVAGTVRPRDPWFKASVKGRQLPLSIASALAEQPLGLAGTIDLGVTAEGQLARPSFTASIAASGVEVGDIELGMITGHASGDPSEIRARVALTGKAGRVELHGDYAFEGDGLAARLVGSGLSIRRLPGLASDSAPVDGKLEIDVKAVGALPFPAVSGFVRARDLAIAGEPLENVEVEARIETNTGEESYEIDVHGLEGIKALAVLKPTEKARARAEKAIASAKAGERAGSAPPPAKVLPISGDVKISLEDLSLAKFLPGLAARGLRVQTTGEALVEIGREGRTITGSLGLSKLEAAFGQETLSAAEPIRIEYDGERLAIRSLDLAGSTGNFSVLGEVGRSIDVAAKGEIDLAFVEPLVPFVARASGKARVDVTAKGSASAPSISGELALATPLMIRPRGMVRELQLTAGKIELSPGLVRVVDLSGTVGGGTFTLAGQTSLVGFTPRDYQVSFDGLALPLRTAEVLVEANVRIRASGSGLAPRITGDVDIIRGRYFKQFQLQDFTFIARKDEEEDVDIEPLSDRLPWLSDVLLNIHARSAGAVELKVDAQAVAMETTLDADVFVRGTAATPRVEGRATLEKGKIRFPAAELDIVEGTVDFVPTVDRGIRPVLSLRAEGLVPPRGEIRNNVSVDIEGTVDALLVNLSSDTGLDRTSILALLITGQTRDELEMRARGQDTGPPVDPRLAAGTQLASVMLGPLETQLERQLNEQLNIDVELMTEVGTDRFRVGAAKELTSRVRLEGGYERSFISSAATTSARALLFLSDMLFLEGSAQNTSGATEYVAGEPEPGASGKLELKLRVVGE